jgi:small subunit ribosomal protein S16
MYWLGVGATPTDTVKNLLSRQGIMLKWTLKKKGKDEATIAAEFEKVVRIGQPLKREKELAKKARRKAAKKKASAPAAPAAPAAEAQA